VPPQFDRDLIQVLVQVPEARRTLAAIADPRDLGHEGLRQILVALKTHPEVEPEALVQRLPGEPERGLLARLLVEERAWADPAVLITEMRHRLERRERQRRIREIRAAIVKAQADGSVGVAALQASLQVEARLMRALAEPRSVAPHRGDVEPG
jgi:hypothetical protein